MEDGCLIITPGDRADIVLAGIAADVSTSFPRVAGLLLTGGQRPAEYVQKLVGGLRRNKVPILCVSTDTFSTAMNVSRVAATILAGDERKIAAALGLFETHVDVADLQERVNLRQSARRTPLMFEYELIRRAKSQRRHIVLPEGTDERILHVLVRSSAGLWRLRREPGSERRAARGHRQHCGHHGHTSAGGLTS
jgi:phosphate acetyltransferase